MVEVDRGDLSGNMRAHRAKDEEVIGRAMDGVLFIDEAYSLAPEGAAGIFGAEAVATLLKAMEITATGSS